MAGNSPLKATSMKRKHVILPQYLDEAVIEEAEKTSRSFSGMIAHILKGHYGHEDPYKERSE
jgi:hypothetical protein